MRFGDVFKIAVLVLVLLLLLLLYLNWKLSSVRKKKEQQEFHVGKKKNKRFSFKLLNTYNKLSGIKMVRRYLEKFRKSYEVRVPGSTRECKEAAMKTVLCIWGVDLALVAVTVVFHMSLYGIACCMLLAYVLSDWIAAYQVQKYDNLIIRELSDFIDLVQFYYYNTNSVEESLLTAVQETKSRLMKLHGQQIFDVMEETEDFEEAVKEFNVRNSDYFVKSFAMAIFVTKQNGDRIVEDESLFISTLRLLKIDIQDEIRKRRKMASAFACVQGVVVAPVFFLGRIQSFGEDSFETVADLYHGSFGIIMTVLLFACTLIVYYAMNKIKNFTKVEKENIALLDFIYRIRPVKRMVNSLVYKNWGKTERLRILLKKTGNSLSTRLFMTKRVVFFVAGFMASLIFLNCVHISSRNYYVSRAADFSSTTSGASDEEGFQMMLIGRYYVDKYKDINIRKKYNSVSGMPVSMFFNTEVSEWFVQQLVSDMQEDIVLDEKQAYVLVQEYLEERQASKLGIANLAGLSYEEAMGSTDHMVMIGVRYLRRVLEKSEKGNALSASLTQKLAEKIAYKIQRSQNEYFHWWELAVVFFIGVLAYNAPVLIIHFEKKSLQFDMEDEVVQFQAAILLLMHIDRVSQETILNWMLMFSRIFEESLRRCVNDYPMDAEAALDQLMENEPFEPFTRIIESLIMCDRVGALRAFGGLKSDRINYQEDRKLENEIMVEKREAISKFLVFVPLFAVVVGYLVAPFIIAAFGDFMAGMAEINTLT